MIKCNAGIQSYWLRVIYKIYRERERVRVLSCWRVGVLFITVVYSL